MPRVPAGYTTEMGSGRLIPIAPANPRMISKRRFMGRLSIPEQNALNAVRLDLEAPLALRAGLLTLAELRDMVDEINLDDADTQAGVVASIGVLASLPEGMPGRIDPTTASARVTAWLADYPQPGEAT